MSDTDTLGMTIEDRLRELLEEDIRMAKDTIAHYGCSDFADYSYACGRVQGFLQALLRLKDAEERARKENY